MNILNREKLLKLAREAGFKDPESDTLTRFEGHADLFERFASLVLSAAQEEREPTAKFQRMNKGGSGEFVSVEWQITPPDSGNLYLAPPSSNQVWNEAVEEAEVVAGYSGLAPTNEVGRAYMQGREDAAENVRTLKRPLQAQEQSASGAVDSQPSPDEQKPCNACDPSVGVVCDEHAFQPSPDDLPPLPDGREALFACEECSGTGKTGDWIPGTFMQPPEPIPCPSCSGSGHGYQATAYEADEVREYARAAIEISRAQAAQQAQAATFPSEEDCIVHIFPSDLERMATSETTATVCSVAVGRPDERSVPLYTAEQMRALLSQSAAPVINPAIKGKTAADWYVAYCEKSEKLKQADGCIERYKQLVEQLRAPACSAAPVSEQPAAQEPPFGWVREWDGDESDLGHYLFEQGEEMPKDGQKWYAVFLKPQEQPAAQTAGVLESVRGQVLETLRFAKEFEQHCGGAHMPNGSWFALHEKLDAAIAMLAAAPQPVAGQVEIALKASAFREASALLSKHGAFGLAKAILEDEAERIEASAHPQAAQAKGGEDE